MMNKIKLIVAAMLAAALCLLCGCADVSNAKITLDSSDKFTKEQLQDAAQAAINSFKYDFDGTLETVEYDKEFSDYWGTDCDVLLRLTFKNSEGEDDFRSYCLLYENNSWTVDGYGYP